MFKSSTQTRYGIIDAARAVAVINMIVYHLCYNIFCVFGVWPAFYRVLPFVIWEQLIGCSFVIISGISLNFSSHGYLRGIIVNLCGLLVTAVTVWLIPSQAIWFGVLNFIGCAMIITFALRHRLSRIRPHVGMFVFLLLFLVCYGVPFGYIGILRLPLIHLPEALYQYKWLAVLGFPSQDFSSADYFPLIPWLFLYLSGYEFWQLICRYPIDQLFIKKVPVLSFIGRYSLIIYLVHQPLLYGICYLIFSLTGRTA